MNSIRCAFWVTAAAMIWFAPIGSAQQETDRELLGQLDDSIHSIHVAALPSAGHTRDGVTTTIAAGFSDLDSWLRANDLRALDRALSRFQAASGRRPDWGWPEYAMARSMVMLHLRGLPWRPYPGIMEGELYLEAALRHLDGALHREPAFQRARQLLVDLTLPSGDRELRDGQLELRAEAAE